MHRPYHTFFRNTFVFLFIFSFFGAGLELERLLYRETFLRTAALKLLGCAIGLTVIKLIGHIEKKYSLEMYPIPWSGVFYSSGIAIQFAYTQIIPSDSIMPLWGAVPILFAASLIFNSFESRLLALAVTTIACFPAVLIFRIYDSPAGVFLILVGLLILAVITALDSRRNLLVLCGITVLLFIGMFLIGFEPIRFIAQVTTPRFEYAHDVIPQILANPNSNPAMTAPFTNLSAAEYLSWCDRCFILAEGLALFSGIKMFILTLPSIGLIIIGCIVIVSTKDFHRIECAMAYAALAVPTIVYFLQNLGIESIVVNEAPIFISHSVVGAALSTLCVWQIGRPKFDLPNRRIYKLPSSIQVWLNGEELEGDGGYE